MDVRRFTDVLVLVTGVAAIMMLVRPGSQGPALVSGIADAWIHAAQGTVGAELAGTTSSGGPAGGTGRPAVPPECQGADPNGLVKIICDGCQHFYDQGDMTGWRRCMGLPSSNTRTMLN